MLEGCCEVSLEPFLPSSRRRSHSSLLLLNMLLTVGGSSELILHARECRVMVLGVPGDKGVPAHADQG